MNVIFREMCAEDIDEVFDVRGMTRENALSRERLAQMGITPAAVAENLARGTRGWVCSCQSRIVGFCMGDSASGEVLVLAVLPEAEGRGVGKTLLSLVVEWLRSFNPTRVWLGAPRDPGVRAHGFYRALGWHPIGETDTNGDEILVLPKPCASRNPRMAPPDALR